MIGQWMLTYQEWIRQVGGAIVVLFGLYIIGVLRIPFLSAEKRLHFHEKPAGQIGTYLVGVAFAAGWTPCVGPILGTILLKASTYDSVIHGVWLLTFYSVGLGLPLFLASLSVSAFLNHSTKARAYMRSISVVSGLFLITVGVMLYTNSFATLAAILTRNGIGWTIGQ